MVYTNFFLYPELRGADDFQRLLDGLLRVARYLHAKVCILHRRNVPERQLQCLWCVVRGWLWHFDFCQLLEYRDMQVGWNYMHFDLRSDDIDFMRC